jgi:apolipoprotein N-acyltransferase
MAEEAVRSFGVTLARWSLALVAGGLVALAHTPYCWPTFVFALAPLMVIWRGRLAPNRLGQVIVEAGLFGSILAWWITPFFAQAAAVRISHGFALHGFCCAVYSLVWVGGIQIESRASKGPMAFSALMVQPALQSDKEVSVWQLQDEMTNKGLQHNGVVDLVVWPEGLLNESEAEEMCAPIAELDRFKPTGRAMTIFRFRRELLPAYRTNCLVGARVRRLSKVAIRGQAFSVMAKYNCGCLLSHPSGGACHEKMALMPITETLPGWFAWLPEIRAWLLPSRNPLELYQPGSDFRPLTFSDQTGVTRRIGVAICYESWLPWLPQYHFKEPLDAICHLAYDGDFKDHPEYTQRMLLTIRLRAIETRTWQLVCSHYSGTAVIDPRGRIIKQLPPGPGVLRTDQLD